MNNIRQSWMNIILFIVSQFLFNNFSLISFWNVFLSMNKLFSIYHVYIYIYTPRFLSESQREEHDKKRGKRKEKRRKTKINCEMEEIPRGSTFKKGRKDSIPGVFRAKHDPSRLKHGRGDSSGEGRGRQESSADRQIYYLRTICHSASSGPPSPPFVCLWDRDIDATSWDFPDSSSLKGVAMDTSPSNFISLTRWLPRVHISNEICNSDNARPPQGVKIVYKIDILVMGVRIIFSFLYIEILACHTNFIQIRMFE